MGYRLHAAKLYKVEYGTGLFNHQEEELNDLLAECPSAVGNDNELCFASEIEVDKSDLVTLIHRLRTMSDEQFAEYKFSSNYTKDIVADNLQRFLDEADQDLDYVKLFWY